ncbi:MAG: response regulator transcription factor [Candidatus Acidiferrum sp.]
MEAVGTGAAAGGDNSHGHFMDLTRASPPVGRTDPSSSLTPDPGPFNIPVPESSVGVLQTQARPTIRILVADDHPAILAMVKEILKAHPGFEVVGEARDGQHAVSLAETRKPDVIVINVTMPKMSGFEAARRIRVHVPDSAIVILSSHKDRQFIAEARKVGANGYVAKSDADAQLIRAIESTVKGEEFFVVE